MADKGEKLSQEFPEMRKKTFDTNHLPEDMEIYPTVKLQTPLPQPQPQMAQAHPMRGPGPQPQPQMAPMPQPQTMRTPPGGQVFETPMPYVPRTAKITPKKTVASKTTIHDIALARTLQEQCRHLSLSLFTRQSDAVRSLGFTSSMGGEGKSLLALVTAQVLAQDSNDPVTLIECNWEHPTLHDYFDVPVTPGLAEWLRGSCRASDILYQVSDTLTIIPAGDGRQDAVKLLKLARQQGLERLTEGVRGPVILDLPPVITSSYGALAASLAETVVVVVRSEAISTSVLAQTCAHVREYASLYGIVLNQKQSRIPRWIQQLL